MTDAVKHTAELKRILSIPRRSTTDDYAQLAAEMTAVLRTPTGTMSLRPVQGLALHDIGVNGGALLPVGVGEGKTIISMLASYVLGAQKPIMLLPAGLIKNAERERRRLSEHWLVPTNIRIFSYEMLGLEQYADELETYNPDAFVCDEVHRLKNLRAACTRRVARFMAKHPRTPFVGMSGTIMRDSLNDFAHILFWALKDKAPLPMLPYELDEWAAALDEPKASRFGFDAERTEPGALLEFATPEERASLEPYTAARRGFRRRLVETSGVVATAGDGESVGSSIRITGQIYTIKPETDAHFKKLREDMETPDGWQLLNGVDVWRHSKEMATGFHSTWDPRPAEEWLAPRRAWGAFVRAVLGRSHTLDSPELVEQAVLAGRIDDGGKLAAWLSVKDTYTPNVVEVWHDDSVLKLAAKWGKQPGIIWTDHTFFAERLSRETGLPYYGAQGLDAQGRYIEDADCSKAIIASIDANRDGKNLQGDPDRGWKGFSRNLFVGPPDGWDALQQAIARTHRPKQLADEVIVDVLLGCREHLSAWRKAVAGTYAARDTVGATPKLLLADVVGFPTDSEIAMLQGSRW